MAKIEAIIFNSIKQGDDVSFAELVVSVNPSHLPYVLSIVKNETAAEEVIFNTLFELREKIATKGTKVRTPEAWVRSIFKNRALNLLRGGKVADKYRDHVLSQGQTAQQAMDALYRAQNKNEILKKLVELLPQLPQTTATIFHLHLTGMPTPEIAQMLSKTDRQIHRQLLKARKFLIPKLRW